MTTPSRDNVQTVAMPAVGSSATISGFNVADHANRLLLAVFANISAASNHCTGVTFGGAGLTSIGQYPASPPTTVEIELFYLKQPTVQSADVVFSLGPSNVRGSGVAICFYDVDQTTPYHAPSAAGPQFNTSPSVTVGSYDSADLIVDFLGASWATGRTRSTGADQTGQANFDNGQMCMGCSTQPGTAGGVMSWTLSSSSNWALAALALNGAGVPPISGTGALTQSKNALAATGTVQTLAPGGGGAIHILLGGGPHQRLLREHATRWRERTYRKNAAGLYVGADA